MKSPQKVSFGTKTCSYDKTNFPHLLNTTAEKCNRLLFRKHRYCPWCFLCPEFAPSGSKQQDLKQCFSNFGQHYSTRAARRFEENSEPPSTRNLQPLRSRTPSLPRRNERECHQALWIYSHMDARWRAPPPDTGFTQPKDKPPEPLEQSCLGKDLCWTLKLATTIYAKKTI